MGHPDRLGVGLRCLECDPDFGREGADLCGLEIRAAALPADERRRQSVRGGHHRVEQSRVLDAVTDVAEELAVALLDLVDRAGGLQGPRPGVEQPVQRIVAGGRAEGLPDGGAHPGTEDRADDGQRNERRGEERLRLRRERCEQKERDGRDGDDGEEHGRQHDRRQMVVLHRARWQGEGAYRVLREPEQREVAEFLVEVPAQNVDGIRAVLHGQAHLRRADLEDGDGAVVRLDGHGPLQTPQRGPKLHGAQVERGERGGGVHPGQR